MIASEPTRAPVRSMILAAVAALDRVASIVVAREPARARVCDTCYGWSMVPLRAPGGPTLWRRCWACRAEGVVADG